VIAPPPRAAYSNASPLLLRRNVFLISNLNLLWNNLKPSHAVTWEKRPTPTSLQPPFSELQGLPLLHAEQSRFPSATPRKTPGSLPPSQNKTSPEEALSTQILRLCFLPTLGFPWRALSVPAPRQPAASPPTGATHARAVPAGTRAGQGGERRGSTVPCAPRTAVPLPVAVGTRRDAPLRSARREPRGSAFRNPHHHHVGS